MLSWLTGCSRRVGCRADRHLLVHPKDLIVIRLVVVRLPQHAIARWRPPLEVSIIVLRRSHEPLHNKQRGITLRVSVASWWRNANFFCNILPAVQHFKLHLGYGRKADVCINTFLPGGKYAVAAENKLAELERSRDG